jgi:hypothetical protein
MITTVGHWIKRWRGKIVGPYEPLKLDGGMFGLWEISGAALAEASSNYHEATLGWMMGLGVYQTIRLDLDHKIRLIDQDSGGTIANRAKGHRRENIYRVAVSLRLTGEIKGTVWPARSVGREHRPGHEGQTLFNAAESYGPERMMSILASDFDRAWTAWATRHSRGMIEATPGIIAAVKEAGQELWPYPDAHGRFRRYD